MKNTITQMMMEHHQQLGELFEMFLKSVGKNNKVAGNALDKLEQEFRKHIAVEENTIFKKFNHDNQIIFLMIERIIKDHGVLLEMMNTLRKELLEEDKVNISAFQELLISHKELEDKTLYPEMDKILDQSQKLSLINEIESNS